MTVEVINTIGFNSLVSDLHASNLPAGLFSSGYNFRTEDDKIVSYSGKTALYTPSSNFNVGAIDFVLSDGNTYYILLGRGAVKVYNGVSWYDISPTSLVATPMSSDQELEWTATRLGNIPVYCNANYYPVYWSPQQTSQILQMLKFDATYTWEAKTYKCKSMRAHKNYLFALNLTEGSSKYPFGYRWSHPADNNGLPPSWDDTDLAYTASKEQIAGSGGDIVDGWSLRDSFCIYSKNAVTILDYTGGEFIWQARPMSGYFGLAANNCIAEFKGVHYFLSDGDILRNDGNSLESVLTNKLRRRLSATVSNSKFENSFALSVPNKSEVWFFIVEEGSTYPSIAYILNLVTDTISLREVSGITAATYGLKAAADDSWDTGPSGTWDSYINAWDDTGFSPFASTIIGAGQTDSAIYTLDETSSNYNTLLERTDWVPKDAIDAASTIVNMYPKITSAGSVQITVGSQQHVGGPVSWKSPITFNPNTDRKVSMRTTGKCHAWRITSVGSYQFKMNGMGIEYEYSGQR